LARPPTSGARHDAARLEVLEHLPRARLGRLRVRVDRQLGREGRLVRRRDAGELRDLARPGLLVEPLHVALLADLERAVDVDLDEVARRHERAYLVTIGAVGRDEGGD